LDYTHPGNELQHADTCEHLRQFARTINQAKIVCFDASIYKYRLQKFVEVPACGAAVASDVPVSDDGIEEILIKCDASEEPETIANRLEDALRSESYLENIQRGYKFAARFTPQSYCDRLLKIAKEFL